jgi:hypothetical protein
MMIVILWMINFLFKIININNINIMNRIEDLEDIIKILVCMLERNNVSEENIRLELRLFHYCYDCINHYRCCKCDELSNNSSDVSTEQSIDDNYTSSPDSDNK